MVLFFFFFFFFFGGGAMQIKQSQDGERKELTQLRDILKASLQSEQKEVRKRKRRKRRIRGAGPLSASPPHAPLFIGGGCQTERRLQPPPTTGQQGPWHRAIRVAVQEERRVSDQPVRVMCSHQKQPLANLR